MRCFLQEPATRRMCAVYSWNRVKIVEERLELHGYNDEITITV